MNSRQHHKSNQPSVISTGRLEGLKLRAFCAAVDQAVQACNTSLNAALNALSSGVLPSNGIESDQTPAEAATVNLAHVIGLIDSLATCGKQLHQKDRAVYDFLHSLSDIVRDHFANRLSE